MGMNTLDTWTQSGNKDIIYDPNTRPSKVLDSHNQHKNKTQDCELHYHKSIQIFKNFSHIQLHTVRPSVVCGDINTFQCRTFLLTSCVINYFDALLVHHMMSNVKFECWSEISWAKWINTHLHVSLYAFYCSKVLSSVVFKKLLRRNQNRPRWGNCLHTVRV